MLRDTSGGNTGITTYAFGLEEHTYNGSGNSSSNTYYYELNGRLIGQFNGVNIQFDLADELGSVLATFNNTPGVASVLANQAYGPYGNKLYSAGTMGTNKGYTGQYSDPTGLDYYNARYYDPVVGRFISADTVESNAKGMDPYAYVAGNPETKNDPTGKCPWCVAIAGLAVFGAAVSAIGNYGFQVTQNYVNGDINPWGNINGSDIGWAAVTGAIDAATIGVGAAFADSIAEKGAARVAARAAAAEYSAAVTRGGTSAFLESEIAGEYVPQRGKHFSNRG